MQVRNMVRDRDAIKPDLTFEATKRQFSKKNPPLGEVQMKTLGIMTHDGVYTSLGLLLSDQCVHTIKVAAFEGTTQSQFKSFRHDLCMAFSFSDCKGRIQRC